MSFSWGRKAAVVALVASFAVFGTLLGLNIGHAADPLQLADPGPLVRWGLPIVKGLFDLSMGTAVGVTVFAAFATAERSKELAASINLIALASGAWALFGVLNLFLTYSNVSGSAPDLTDAYGQGLWLFITQIQLGQYLGINVLGAAVMTLGALMIRRIGGLVALVAVGLVGLIPIALTGHAAGTANHSMAVNSMGLHLVGVSVWVGGLVALLALRKSPSAAELTSRYSTLALFGFALVAISGLAAAWIRLGSIDNLFTEYGILLVLKSVGLIVLGGFGAAYRVSRKGKAVDLKLILAELAVMAATAGLAAALARTAPPADQAVINPTPAQILTGEPLPPELTAERWFTAYRIDLLWLVIALFAAGAYLYGVARLRKRGDQWPIGRTISWLLGLAGLVWVTSGPINAYEEYLFSAHMIGHMILAMMIPVMLVPGAPVTLISRAAAKRHDDSRGLREWVLWAVHTKYAQFIAHPVVAAVLFASSLVTFYYTPLFAWSTHDHLGHEWMVVHFLITGYLFAQALVGIDPGPNRLPFAVRLLLLIATMAFHAFFGLSLMSGHGLLLADWYGAMGRTWGQTPIDDQQTGGAIAWGIGETPTAILTIMVSVQWFKSDAKDAKRLDRQSDRTGGADIDAYNQMLAKLAKQDERTGGGAR